MKLYQNADELTQAHGALWPEDRAPRGSNCTYPLGSEVAGTYLPGVEITFLILAFSIWAIRIYSRFAILKAPGLDDLFVTLALLASITLTVTHMLAVGWGLGRHMGDLCTRNAEPLWLTEFIMEWVFPLGSMFVKFAIGFFYLRFVGKRTKKAIWCTMGFIACSCIGISTFLTFRCIPVEKWWKYSNTGKCMYQTLVGVMLFAQQIFNVLSDFLLFILPIPTIWRIQLPLRKKMGIMSLMSLGLLICIISLLRIKLLLLALLANGGDNSWYMYSVFVSGALELQLCIITACLPFCKPVGTKILALVSNYIPFLKRDPENRRRPRVKSDLRHLAYTTGDTIFGTAKGQATVSSKNSNTKFNSVDDRKRSEYYDAEKFPSDVIVTRELIVTRTLMDSTVLPEDDRIMFS